MAFASERVDSFDLAFLDVHEAVRLFALLDHDRALGVRRYLARCPQCLHVRGRKRCPYHLAQIFANRLHASSQGCARWHIEYLGRVEAICAGPCGARQGAGNGSKMGTLDLLGWQLPNPPSREDSRCRSVGKLQFPHHGLESRLGRALAHRLPDQWAATMQTLAISPFRRWARPPRASRPSSTRAGPL